MAGKTVMTDMIFFGLKQVDPACIILITSDQDYAYTCSKLSQERCRIVLIAAGQISNHLRDKCDEVWDWRTDILKLPPANLSQHQLAQWKKKGKDKQPNAYPIPVPASYSSTSITHFSHTTTTAFSKPEHPLLAFYSYAYRNPANTTGDSSTSVTKRMPPSFLAPAPSNHFRLLSADPPPRLIPLKPLEPLDLTCDTPPVRKRRRVDPEPKKGKDVKGKGKSREEGPNEVEVVVLSDQDSPAVQPKQQQPEQLWTSSYPDDSSDDEGADPLPTSTMDLSDSDDDGPAGRNNVLHSLPKKCSSSPAKKSKKDGRRGSTKGGTAKKRARAPVLAGAGSVDSSDEEEEHASPLVKRSSRMSRKGMVRKRSILGEGPSRAGQGSEASLEDEAVVVLSD
ncbi:hypothetical protein JCM8547_005784 [Rhodosporidiobolus lusitaniae]